MIFQTGHFVPTARQRKLMRLHADNRFCATVPEDFGEVPKIADYSFDYTDITALALSYVDPHQDPWVAPPKDNEGEDGPPGRRALFWLVDTAKFHSIVLQVGNTATRMKAGDFVVFDDRIMHSVYSPKKWFGCAYQLRPV